MPLGVASALACEIDKWNTLCHYVYLFINNYTIGTTKTQKNDIIHFLGPTLPVSVVQLKTPNHTMFHQMIQLQLRRFERRHFTSLPTKGRSLNCLGSERSVVLGGIHFLYVISDCPYRSRLAHRMYWSFKAFEKYLKYKTSKDYISHTIKEYT